MKSIVLSLFLIGLGIPPLVGEASILRLPYAGLNGTLYFNDVTYVLTHASTCLRNYQLQKNGSKYEGGYTYTANYSGISRQITELFSLQYQGSALVLNFRSEIRDNEKNLSAVPSLCSSSPSCTSAQSLPLCP